jgi:hypothetical protein
LIRRRRDARITRSARFRRRLRADRRECVEVGQDLDAVAIRDTKDRAGAMLQFTPDVWRTFADQVKRS